MTEDNKDIELRSEKVRNIVGKIPPQFLRIGISVISAIIICVLMLTYFIPFPQYKDISLTFYSHPFVQTIQSPETGVFILDVNSSTVCSDEKVGVLISENDSLFHFYADVAGTILFNCSNGDFVLKNSVLSVIIPDSFCSVHAIGYIPITEINEIKEGLSVSVLSDEIRLFGYISKIHPIPETESRTGNVYYKLEVSFLKEILVKNRDILLPNKNYVGKILISDEPILKKLLLNKS